MKKLKRFSFFILVGMLLFSLFFPACGKDNHDSGSDTGNSNTATDSPNGSYTPYQPTHDDFADDIVNVLISLFRNLKRIFGEQAFSVFIQAPSVETLRQRLIGRGTDTEEAIERRVAKAASEMEFAAGKFDYVLVNDDLQTAFAEAEKIIDDFLQK